jgi:predicted nucleotidyltransferase
MTRTVALQNMLEAPALEGRTLRGVPTTACIRATALAALSGPRHDFGAGGAAAGGRCVILFGSHAQNAATDASDIDVLVVGPGRRRRADGIDLVCLSEAEAESDLWLGSELASHIAAFGRVLAGEADWLSAVRLDSRAIDRKKRLIAAREQCLGRAIESADASSRALEELATRLRRDLQRLALLIDGRPVPVTCVLDREAAAWGEPQGEIERLCRVGGLKAEGWPERPFDVT